jgi:tetratricopeptide (TPR) repeat protein
MNKTNKALVLAAAIGAACLGLPLRGDITGTVDGVIKDAATGELLEGVKIAMVYSKSESMAYSLVSDKKGHFYKSGLVPGAYSLTFEKEGYVPQSGSVRAIPGQATPLDVRMEPGSGAARGGVSVGKLASGGSGLLSAGKFDEAVVTFSDAIAKAPSEPVLYYYRGFALERSGKSDQALEDYGKAIELKPDFILPLTRSGIILGKKREFDKASEFYRRAVELNGRDPETFYNYGVCLISTGEKEEARGAFEKLLALDPYYADGYYQLGLILLGSGDSAGAKTLFQKFVELDPDSPNTALAKEILKSLN